MVVLTIILVAAYLIYILNTTPGGYKPGLWPEADAAVNQAKHLYQTEKQRGTNFTAGPCLSNAIQPGWVADLVHNPRQLADDLSENQCAAYKEGRISHFVELDLDGNLVRIK